MRAAAALLLVCLAAPAGARAQAPDPTPTPAAPAPTPAPATIRLVLERVNGARAEVLPGARFRVRGIVEPYVPGQTVTVRFQRGAAKLRVVTVPVLLPPRATAGQFVVGFATARPGRVLVRASHLATPEMATAVAAPRRVTVVAPRAGPGARGPAVRLLQQRLAALGYVVGVRGRYDARTARAVLAFRKVSGLPRTTDASRVVFRRLVAGGGRFAVRYPAHGRHVEADLTHQVLALVDHGRVQRLYPLSSGKASTPTVLGAFRVYRKEPGTNGHGMVFSNYFTGGYAIHGYAEVPVFPASHGCLRVPIPDAVPIDRWIRIGDRVDVYYRSGRHVSRRIAHPGP